MKREESLEAVDAAQGNQTNGWMLVNSRMIVGLVGAVALRGYALRFWCRGLVRTNSPRIVFSSSRWLSLAPLRGARGCGFFKISPLSSWCPLFCLEAVSDSFTLYTGSIFAGSSMGTSDPMCTASSPVRRSYVPVFCSRGGVWAFFRAAISSCCVCRLRLAAGVLPAAGSPRGRPQGI